VLIDAGKFLDNSTTLHEHLRSLLPEARKMRAALSRVATSLQWSYSELGAEDHLAVGPYALDVALYHMTAGQL
jgi:hypothetical protein